MRLRTVGVVIVAAGLATGLSGDILGTGGAA